MAWQQREMGPPSGSRRTQLGQSCPKTVDTSAEADATYGSTPIDRFMDVTPIAGHHPSPPSLVSLRKKRHRSFVCYRNPTRICAGRFEDTYE